MSLGVMHTSRMHARSRSAWKSIFDCRSCRPITSQSDESYILYGVFHCPLYLVQASRTNPPVLVAPFRGTCILVHHRYYLPRNTIFHARYNDTDRLQDIFRRRTETRQIPRSGDDAVVAFVVIAWHNSDRSAMSMSLGFCNNTQPLAIGGCLQPCRATRHPTNIGYQPAL